MSRFDRVPSRQRMAAVIGAAGLAAVMLVWRSSDAALTGATTSGANAFSSGTVTISDDDSGVAVLSAPSLVPGASGVGCLSVTYTGSLTANVRLYAAGNTATNALDSYLTLQVETGAFASPPGSPSCATFAPTGTIVSGTVASFAAANTNFGTGAGSWTPTGAGQTRDFRISYALSSAAPPTTRGSNASIALVWEAQNT